MPTPVPPLILPSRTRTLVHVAKNWPTDESGWTQIDAWCQTASVGMCNDVGGATLFTPSGLVFKPGMSVVKNIKSHTYSGKYVRVSKYNPSGPIVDGDDGTRYSEVWHGLVGGRKIEPDGQGIAFYNSYQCAGILSALDSVTPPWHFAVSALGNTQPAGDIGAAPVFNRLGSKRSGNRSTTKYNFGDGVAAYVFERSKTSVFWTAADVVEYYLALFHYFGGGGLRFSVDGQISALAWVEQWDTSNHSCGEAISRVMSQKQGIGYRCKVVAGQPVITVKSISPDAVDIPKTDFTDAFTLPANDEKVIVDLTGDTHIQTFSISESQTATSDELITQLAKTWYAVTFSLFDDFDQDWTPADESSWYTFHKSDNYGTLDTNFGIARVFRRFKLKSTWSGAGIGGFVMPTSRNFGSSTLNGVNGLTGVNDNLLPTTRVAGPMFELTGDLPCLDGYDWSTVNIATVDKTRRNAPALSFIADSPYMLSWTTLALTCGMSSVSISVDSDMAAITFDESVVEWIRSSLISGIPIYITLGVRAQFNDSVSWQRDPALQPRDQKRVYSKQRPNLSRKIIPKGTIVGVTTSGDLVSPSQDVVIHDDLNIANSILAVSTPWNSEPAWSISYTKVGEIDENYAVPGQMVTEVDHLEGDHSTTAQTVIGVVTNVAFDFAEPGSTRVTTSRIPVDVEAIIS